MSSKISKLASSYAKHLSVPWQDGLAAIQRVIFAVYDKADELRLRANVEEFALLTQQAGKNWLLIDLTNSFPKWMADQEYRDAYFESPEDLAGYQNGELTEFVAELNQNIIKNVEEIPKNYDASRIFTGVRGSARQAFSGTFTREFVGSPFIITDNLIAVAEL